MKVDHCYKLAMMKLNFSDLSNLDPKNKEQYIAVYANVLTDQIKKLAVSGCIKLVNMPEA